MALNGHFGAHHVVAAERIFGHLDFVDASIATLTEQIDARIRPYAAAQALLAPIPGFDRIAIDMAIAETGAMLLGPARRAHSSAAPNTPQRSLRGGLPRASVLVRRVSPTTDWRPTDQKVGGSSPSRRARSRQRSAMPALVAGIALSPCACGHVESSPTSHAVQTHGRVLCAPLTVRRRCRADFDIPGSRPIDQVKNCCSTEDVEFITRRDDPDDC